MKNFSYLCFVLLALARLLPAGRPAPRGPEPQATRRLAYRFDFSQPGRVHVSLKLDLPESGSELLQLPSRRAEATGLERAIEALKITGTGVSLEPESRPWLYRMRAKPGTTVQLDYELVQDWTGSFRESQRHRVLLRPELVMFNGENGLVAPKMSGSTAVQVSFEFEHVAAGQTVVTSFGTELHQTMTGSWSEVMSGLFAAGVLTTRRLNTGEGTTLLAVAGRPSFSEGELARKLEKILETERTFWRDSPPAWFAVVLAPFEVGSSGGSGSAFTHAFSLYLAPAESFGHAAESLAAHEAFHAWNPAALGTVADPQGLAWFVEGATTYYQDLMLRRAGLIDESTYLSRLNAILRENALSPEFPVREADLQTPLDSDEARYREPYLRGAAVALWLNAVISRESGGKLSLDDLMRSLRAQQRELLTADRIFTAMGRYVDPQTVKAVRNAVEDGGEIPVLPDSLGRCVVFRERMVWTYDLGFDPSQLIKEDVLRGLDPESAGYRAGLRDGQVLLGWTTWPGNAEKEVALTVRRGDGGIERVRYLPRGRQVPVAQAEAISHCAVGSM